MDIAVSIWQDRISPVFDVSRRILVINVDDGRILNRRIEQMNSDDPFQKVAFLKGLNVGTLICGAVSDRLHEIMINGGIRTIAFTAGPVEEVLEAFLHNHLQDPAFCMPGCRARRPHGCRRANKP